MKSLILIFTILGCFSFLPASAQYVQPERDDTVRLYANTPFDSIAAKKQLAEGTGTIKGEAFTRPTSRYGGLVKTGQKIKANKITVILFPVTEYLVEYLDVKKKENPKKLKYAYIDPVAWRHRLTAVTNSDGEFTFPKMKPGKYYLEAILPWTETRGYREYSGSGYGSYGGRVDYYDQKYYDKQHYDKLTEFVEVKSEGEVVDVKLK